MFYAFENTKVVDIEIPFDKMLKKRTSGKILVVKTGQSCLLTGSIPRGQEEYQLKALQNPRIKVINIIRDGRDVLESENRRVRPSRWVKAINESERFAEIVDLTVHYEALVRSPNRVQKKLAEVLDLVAIARFSSYPRFVPKEVFDLWHPTEKKEYQAHPLHRRRIGKDKNWRKRLGPKELVRVETALKKAGYM
jgi:hypothetical protein